MRRFTGLLRNIPLRFVAAGFLSAFLLVLSFPAYSVWWLSFIGFVPFLLGLMRARTVAEVAWMGASQAIFFILLGFSWISYVVTNFGGLPWIVGKIVLVLFALFGEIQFFVFALIAFSLLTNYARWSSKLEKRRGFLVMTLRLVLTFLVLPLVYIGLDYLNPKIFPNTLGHVLHNWLPVAQLAEYTGVFGLTVPILITNFSLAILLARFWPTPTKGPAGRAFAGPLAATIALVVVAVFLWRVDGWGTKRIEQLNALERTWTRHLKISVIQGNIGDVDKLASEKGYEPAIQAVLAAHRDATLDSIKHFHPDLVIWPETSFPFLYTHLEDQGANRSGAARDQWMADFVKEIQTPIFFGAYSTENKRDFNTAFLVKPPYEKAGVYRKYILLAFGEYVPLGPLGPLIQSIVPMIADFGRGGGPAIFEVKGVKLAPQICYEGIFPEHSRGGVKKLGADVLLNITNDSWFGRTHEPWLHLLLTIFRTIELRRPMIRSTNTGISTIVDITGEMRWSTRLFEPASIDTTLSLPGPGQLAPETFYMRHGEIFAQACAVVALLAAFFVFGPGLLSTSRRAITSVRTRKRH